MAPATIADLVPPAHGIAGPAIVPAGTGIQVFAVPILITVRPSWRTGRHALAGKTDPVRVCTRSVAGPAVLGIF